MKNFNLTERIQRVRRYFRKTSKEEVILLINQAIKELGEIENRTDEIWAHIMDMSRGKKKDIIRDFSYYPEDENQWIENYNHYLINKKLKIGIPNINWFRSSFFRVEAYDKIKLKKLPRLKSTHELYVDDEAWCTVEYDSWK